MNIYDTKSINCSKCGKFIGEIDFDAVVIFPKCGKCVDPIPEGDDKISYLRSSIQNNNQKIF
jgi:phage FluMu protein Com